MYKYKFRIFRQSRALTAVFVLPIAFVGGFLLGLEFKSFLIPLGLIISSVSLLYYYAVGYMFVIIKDECLFLDWKKKMFFNYKNINPIKLERIICIVIDNGKLLKKIKTIDETVYINNPKIKGSEAYRFIAKLRELTKNYNPEIIDSWDEFERKGYLKLAYVVNTIILVLAIFGVLIWIILKEFRLSSLSIFLLFIPQMLLYRQQMKSTLKKK